MSFEQLSRSFFLSSPSFIGQSPITLLGGGEGEKEKKICRRGEEVEKYSPLLLQGEESNVTTARFSRAEAIYISGQNSNSTDSKYVVYETKTPDLPAEYD